MFTVSKPSQTLLRSSNGWHLLLVLLVLFPRIRDSLSLTLSLSGRGRRGCQLSKDDNVQYRKFLRRG
jgi:hypothetical protein